MSKGEIALLLIVGPIAMVLTAWEFVKGIWEIVVWFVRLFTGRKEEKANREAGAAPPAIGQKLPSSSEARSPNKPKQTS